MILVAQGLKVGDDLSLSDSEGEIPQLDDEEKMMMLDGGLVRWLWCTMGGHFWCWFGEDEPEECQAIEILESISAENITQIWQGIENDATKKNNEEMPSKESEELAMVNEVTCYYIRHVSLDLAGREIKEPKLSIEEPLTLELKPLMRLLKYAY
ncbi:hypothetical protein V6N13_061961 [Hibiscus sabdariffa]